MSDTLPPREWIAPDGALWVCIACGKHARERDKVGDESCFMNAVLMKDDRTLFIANGRVYQCDTFYRCPLPEEPPTLR